MLTSGVYSAERAAALSGVPRSTIHYWSRNGVLAPSVSPEKVKLWSYADLMGLRTIYWLRSRKPGRDGIEIPASTMAAVRHALAALAASDTPLWNGDGSSLVVNAAGDVYVEGPAGLERPETRQLADRDLLRPTAPFISAEGTRGPDLRCPRPMLRIVPGKLGGSPHVMDTRVETRALAALHDGGMLAARIAVLYPHLTEVQISEALDLEEQLKRNLLAA
jgi:uncharacterized protein (DUF433 family)